MLDCGVAQIARAGPHDLAGGRSLVAREFAPQFTGIDFGYA